MPTYEYQCQKCEHVTEVSQAPWDKETTECEKCGEKATRIISRTGGHRMRGSTIPGTELVPDSMEMKTDNWDMHIE